MDETKRTIINYVDGEYTLLNDQGQDVMTLSVGTCFELKLRGQWCRVRMGGGGYKGRYYVTAAGERGRLALCMEARTCEPGPGEPEVERIRESSAALVRSLGGQWQAVRVGGASWSGGADVVGLISRHSSDCDPVQVTLSYSASRGGDEWAVPGARLVRGAAATTPAHDVLTIGGFPPLT